MTSLYYALGTLIALGTLYRVVLRRPAHWLWKRNVGEPLTSWHRKIVMDVVGHPNGSGTVTEIAERMEKSVDRAIAEGQTRSAVLQEFATDQRKKNEHLLTTMRRVERKVDAAAKD